MVHFGQFLDFCVKNANSAPSVLERPCVFSGCENMCFCHVFDFGDFYDFGCVKLWTILGHFYEFYGCLMVWTTFWTIFCEFFNNVILLRLGTKIVGDKVLKCKSGVLDVYHFRWFLDVIFDDFWRKKCQFLDFCVKNANSEPIVLECLVGFFRFLKKWHFWTLFEV